ncbi:MAG: hypothetical protein DWQ36_09225 [Acidobacteria bacterium]|nr:MAG: hypothetical protein DWQ30_22470 [Acidobacteriota bacterium]REK08541.1 MAG: hypothetical protein DWQ36_09225 [Acidobacteriota bacterium]
MRRSWLTLAGSVLCTLLALVLAAPVHGDAGQTFSGNTENGPTFNRPVGGGPSVSTSLVRYRVQRFRLEQDSSCYIVSAQDYDGYLHLYRNSFNPALPLVNLVDGDDDAELGIGTSRIPADLNTNSVALTAGTYFLVTSGFSASSQGFFQNTIHCNVAQPLQGSCSQYFGVPIEQQVCLQNRFVVAINWNTASNSGLATPVRSGTNDTALYWFFGETNWEVMIKVLDACGLNGHYWVFIGALTDQGYSISVGDAQTGQVNAYSNFLGDQAPAVTDTTAFPCN